MTSEPPPVDPTPQTPGVPPGWYPDPASGTPRWWDGTSWTQTFGGGYEATPIVKPTNAPAVVAFVAGVIAALTLFTVLSPVSILASIVAVFLGIDGVIRARRKGARGMSLSVWAICLGALVLAIISVGLFAYRSQL